MDRLEPFRLERFFARHEFSARRLLCTSDCETLSLRELLAMEEGAAEAFQELRLGYTETRGGPGLRRDLAALYSPTESGGPGAEGILVHAGAAEAILDFFLAVVEPGDRVVANWPCYQSLEELPRKLGAELLRWTVREEGGRWRFDPGELEGLLSRPTKLVVLNAPHNPTGALPTHAEFDAIVGACRRSGAILLVDEVYRGLEVDPARILPPACEAYENGVSLNVLSKTAGLAGLRIGWLAARRADLLDAVAVVKDYSSLCASGPSEFLAGVAARHFDRIAARNRGLCAANLGLFRAFAARHPDFVALTPPEGSSVAFPRLAGRAEAEFGGDAERLALALLADRGLLLLPGAHYLHDAGHWRLGFGRADFPEGLRELEEWVEARGL